MTLPYIIFGLQIGLQAMASYYCFRIMLLKVTPIRPYLFLVIGLFVRAIILVNDKIPFMNLNTKYFLQILVSIALMTAFAEIYRLIKDRGGYKQL